MQKPERITFMGETGECTTDTKKRGVISKLKNNDMTQTIRSRIMK